MKTEKELNDDILKITMTIKETYPELSKYIIEMPLKISSTVSEEMNLKNLKDYYDSLETVLKKYTNTHTGTLK